MARRGPSPEFHKVEVKRSRAKELSESLGRIVVGQPEAAGAVASGVLRFEAGMNARNKPIGVFLFLGPTGVGKTEMAHALSNEWFGDPNSENLLIVDMGEFASQYTVSRFVGSPPGYVGETEKPRITHQWANRATRKILVLDEVEKAHPLVLDPFLSVFEKGVMMARTGNKGEGDAPLHFEDTLIICTSNAGSQDITQAGKAPLGFVKSDYTITSRNVEKAALKALEHHFRPEMLGRMTKIVFRPLAEESYNPILNKFIQETNEAHLGENLPTIQLSREVRDILFDLLRANPEFGGRRLKEDFDRLIVERLADAYMDGAVEFDDVVRFEYENGEITLYAKKDKRRIEMLERLTAPYAAPIKEVPPFLAGRQLKRLTDGNR